MKNPMFASIRKYTGVPQLSTELVKNEEAIKAVLQPIKGFHAYYVIKTNDGVVTLTVCEDRAGADESNRVSAVWLKDKLPTFTTTPPDVMVGEVVIQTERQLVSVATD